MGGAAAGSAAAGGAAAGGAAAGGAAVGGVVVRGVVAGGAAAGGAAAGGVVVGGVVVGGVVVGGAAAGGVVVGGTSTDPPPHIMRARRAITSRAIRVFSLLFLIQSPILAMAPAIASAIDLRMFMMRLSSAEMPIIAREEMDEETLSFATILSGSRSLCDDLPIRIHLSCRFMTSYPELSLSPTWRDMAMGDSSRTQRTEMLSLSTSSVSRNPYGSRPHPPLSEPGEEKGTIAAASERPLASHFVSNVSMSASWVATASFSSSVSLAKKS